MKNYEKYKDEIKNCKGETFCSDFIQPYILKQSGCSGMNCDQCKMLQTIWLMEEYEEPEVDWSRVEVDTPILVRNDESDKWLKRHFAKYEGGVVYTWKSGRTSWTEDCMMEWNYAKLAEDEGECKEEKECEEPEVDWSKVPVDTPILVKDYEDAKWSKRYFAKYENGIIYAWQAGCTSQSIAVHMSKWNYAKLIENEETK